MLWLHRSWAAVCLHTSKPNGLNWPKYGILLNSICSDCSCLVVGTSVGMLCVGVCTVNLHGLALASQRKNRVLTCVPSCIHQMRRLPVLHSSMIALDISLGTESTIEFDDYLNGTVNTALPLRLSCHHSVAWCCSTMLAAIVLGQLCHGCGLRVLLDTYPTPRTHLATYTHLTALPFCDRP